MNGIVTTVVALGFLLSVVMADASAKPSRILFLTKSEGYEHSAIAKMENSRSFAGTVLDKLAKENNATIEETKDASLINAEDLKKYDMVILYTQGDLTKPGKDGGAVMSANGVAELTKWVEEGGRLMGFHSATDTFRTSEGAEVTPFIRLIGGEFTNHGAQFRGTLKVVDPKHPTMRSLPQTWKLKEEWYLFRNLNKEKIHVLAVMDPGEERSKQVMYNTPAYPMIWCSALGKGKVYFNGLGHREQVWNDPVFQKSVIDAFQWMRVRKSKRAEIEPNYDKVVPTDMPEK